MPFQAYLIALAFVLAGCGAERYQAANNANRWDDMMACRHAEWQDRGGPARAIFAGAGAGLGGAVGGALAGGAMAIGTRPEKFSDAVDRCMAARGYVALAPNPLDH